MRSQTRPETRRTTTTTIHAVVKVVVASVAVCFSSLEANALSFLQNRPNNDPTASLRARESDQRTAFEKIRTAGNVYSVATGDSVLLTDQWRNNNEWLSNLPFFGTTNNQNQRCVVEFLRHFG